MKSHRCPYCNKEFVTTEPDNIIEHKIPGLRFANYIRLGAVLMSLTLGGFVFYQVSTMGNNILGMSGFRQYGPDARLSIVSDRMEKNNSSVVILGELKNEGKYTWNTLQFQISFFDKAGAFIDQCSTASSLTSLPGESQFLKLKCTATQDKAEAGSMAGGIEPSSLPKIASYKIAVINAYSLNMGTTHPESLQP